jgi:membrane protein
MQRKSYWELAKKSVLQWFDDDPFQMAAALSYYTLFSLAPLIIIAISIAGFAFGREAAQNQIVATLQGMIGQESAQAVQGIVENASKQPKTGIISTVIGVVALIFGAGGVVGQLQTSLNRLWGVTPKPNQGIWVFVRQRFISYAMILAIGFLLLVSLMVSAVISGLTQWMGTLLGGADIIAHALDLLVSFIFATALFAMIYKFLPDVDIRWRDVWVGAVITSVLFSLGKFLIGIYLGSSGVSSTYGAAGSLITVLLWVYYSSLIFFLGAEFTQVYAGEYGAGVAPAEYAEPVSADSESKKRASPPPQDRAARRLDRRRRTGHNDERRRPGH